MARRTFIAVFALLATLRAPILPQTVLSQSDASKRGGICFRVDDNQPVVDWREYADVFARYGFHFSFAINLDPIVSNPTYVDLLRSLQADGHEMMDHTPDHSTFYFFSPNAAAYTFHQGVDHINGSKVCLAFASLDTLNRPPASGTLVDGMLISDRAGAFGPLAADPNSYFGVFVEDQEILYRIRGISAAVSGDPDTLLLESAWSEPIGRYGPESVSYRVIGVFDIRMSLDALLLLGQRTRELAAAASLVAPTTWIQPGGITPQINLAEASTAYGAILGYASASTYLSGVLRAFDQYDPNGRAAYGWDWGDFTEDVSDLQTVKSTIANRIARHYINVGHSHFNSLLGGWQGYLGRMDSLLAWCEAMHIPVHTQRTWNEILHSIPQNPYTNIIPSLATDLDGNGIPDGYTATAAVAGVRLVRDDGKADDGTCSYAVQRTGTILQIRKLAGLEKGRNDFLIWTKGAPGDKITVEFALGTTSQRIRATFPADTPDWRRFALNQSIAGDSVLVIPDTINTVDLTVSCSAYASGEVRVSGMELRAYVNSPLKIISEPPRYVNYSGTFRYQLDVAAANASDTISYSLTAGPAWLMLQSNGVLTGTAPASPDTSLVRIEARDQHGNVDEQTFSLIAANLRRLNISPRVVDFGRLWRGEVRDTTLVLHSPIDDSLTVYAVYSDDNRLQITPLDGISRGSTLSVAIRFDAGATGPFNSHIIVVSNAASQRDTITVSGTVDTFLTVEQNGLVPMSYDISQAYPNPFNPRTSFLIDLPADSRVDVDVFDMLGRLVRRIMDGLDLKAGRYKCSWEGITDGGDRASSGVYFLRLSARQSSGNMHFLATRRLLLLK